MIPGQPLASSDLNKQIISECCVDPCIFHRQQPSFAPTSGIKWVHLISHCFLVSITIFGCVLPKCHSCYMFPSAGQNFASIMRAKRSLTTTVVIQTCCVSLSAKEAVGFPG